MRERLLCFLALSLPFVANAQTPCDGALDASFSFTTAGNTVTFHDQSVVNLSPVHYSWHFGDGNTGSGEDPIHTYADSGLYHVCLTIWAVHVNDTCSATFCHDVHVTHPGTAPCDGALDASFSFTTAGNTVTFHDQSVVNLSPVHYSWHFGDGNTGSGEDPIHTYADSGLYHVCLTIWAVHVNDTCSATFCHDVHVVHHGGPHHAVHAAPMPFSDELVFFGSTVRDVQRVDIWSSSGQLRASVAVTQEGPVRVRLAELAPGLYVAHLIGPGSEERISVVKE